MNKVYGTSGRSRKKGRSARHGRPAPSSKKRLLLILGVAVLGIWAITRLGGSSDADTQTATLTIHSGTVEFSSEGTDFWINAKSGLEAQEGDRLRTGANSRAELTILGNTTLFLGDNTELSLTTLRQRSNGKKELKLTVPRGQVWVSVAENEFSRDSGSKFSLHTGRQVVRLRGTIFDLQSGEADTLRVLRGGIDTSILDTEGDEAETILVDTGKKLILNDTTRDQLLADTDPAVVLQTSETEFRESEWHLLNLERVAPQEAATIRGEIDRKASLKNTLADPDAEPLSAPTFLEPLPGTVVPASADALPLSGTAPAEAFQVSVNGYTLTKFQAGDRKWTYFASRKFGTLVPGENTYEVIATARDGRQSPPAKITVTYAGTSTPATIEPVDAGSITDPDFAAPIVTSPVIADTSKPFETNEAVLRIEGLVDPKTNAVEVNGFRLKKYVAGSEKWLYTANAQYGNLSVGANTFVVRAFGPDGKTATTQIHVVYQPK